MSTIEPKAAFPLSFSGVTHRIEKVREEAGQDIERLAALSAVLERELREEFPDEPELARYAHVILDNYQVMARSGFFPEVFRDEEL